MNMSFRLGRRNQVILSLTKRYTNSSNPQHMMWTTSFGISFPTQLPCHSFKYSVENLMQKEDCQFSLSKCMLRKYKCMWFHAVLSYLKYSRIAYAVHFGVEINFLSVFFIHCVCSFRAMNFGIHQRMAKCFVLKERKKYTAIFVSSRKKKTKKYNKKNVFIDMVQGPTLQIKITIVCTQNKITQCIHAHNANEYEIRFFLRC